MGRSIRFKQSDLFAVGAIAPLSLPAEIRTEFVSLLSALLLEVSSHQLSERTLSEKELNHEQ